MDFTNVKKLEIPEGTVKQLEVSGGGIWKSTWLFTITLGDYVTSVKYSTDGTTWTSISESTTLEIDAEDTLLVQAESYSVDDVYWHYTQHNFNESFDVNDDGGSVTVYQTRARIYYTTTVTAGSYVSTVKAKVNSGSWVTPDSSVTISHLYEDTVYWTAETYETSDAQYTYTGTLFGDFTNSTGESITISQTRTLNQYTITLASTYGHWENSSGTTITSISNIDYGTSISSSSNVLTVGSNNYTFVIESDTAQYDYEFSSITGIPLGGSVVGDVTVTGTASRTTITYVVSITGGTGVSSVYTSTSSTSTSSGGDSYPYGSTVYGFVVLSAGYGPASGWELVTGSTYRVGSVVVDGPEDLGTFNAVANTYTLTIHRRYHAITGIQSYSSSLSSDTDETITVTYNASYSYTYSKTGYDTKTTSGTWTKAGNGEVNLTTSPSIYGLGLNLTNWSGHWYSNTNYDTEISWMYYGYTAYFRGTPNAGYKGTVGSTTYYYGDYYTTSVTNTTGSVVLTGSKISSYTLSVNVSGGSYGSWSITRTSTRSADTKTNLVNGDTIYEKDVLVATSSAASPRYTDWDCTPADLTICTGSWNGGDTTSPSITVTARNGAVANLYRRKWYGSYYGDWVHLSSNFGTGATSSYTDTGLEFNTTYNYHVARNQNRYRYDRSASSSNYTGTNGVTGNVTASFSFSEGGANLEQNWIAGDPSTVDISTGSRNSYPVYVTAGTGCQSVYLSTNASATSGSASGTSFYYGETVYSFLEVADGYYLTGYTKVGGTDYEAGAKYRISSVTVDGNEDFGTYTCSRNPKINLSVTSGEASIKVNGSNYTSGTDMYFNYNSQVTVEVQATHDSDDPNWSSSNMNKGYFLSFPSGAPVNATGADSFTCNRTTEYRKGTYTFNITSNWTTTFSTVKYNAFCITSPVRVYGTLTFNANGTVAPVDYDSVVNAIEYYSSSLGISLTVKSVEIKTSSKGDVTSYGRLACGEYPYGANVTPQVINSYSGLNPTSNLVLLETFSTTRWYHKLVYSYTLTSSQQEKISVTCAAVMSAYVKVSGYTITHQDILYINSGSYQRRLDFYDYKNHIYFYNYSASSSNRVLYVNTPWDIGVSRSPTTMDVNCPTITITLSSLYTYSDNIVQTETYINLKVRSIYLSGSSLYVRDSTVNGRGTISISHVGRNIKWGAGSSFSGNMKMYYLATDTCGAEWEILVGTTMNQGSMSASSLQTPDVATIYSYNGSQYVKFN